MSQSTTKKLPIQNNYWMVAKFWDKINIDLYLKIIDYKFNNTHITK